MDVYSLTDVGKERANNQDAFSNYFHSRFTLLIVSDGMGGHNAGEVASHCAVESAQEFMIQNKEADQPEELLIDAIHYANSEIFHRAQNNPAYFNMGTTIVAALIMDRFAAIAHVGDSRCYLLRGGELRQVTRDHSLVEDLMRKGLLTEEDAKNHPDRSAVTRALGTDLDVEVDMDPIQLEEGDVLLLATDGLSNMVDKEQIQNILSRDQSAKTICEQLISTANRNGGVDNITATVYKYRS